MKNMNFYIDEFSKKKLKKTNNVFCFEIFGYDFIVDRNFKPWILEINPDQEFLLLKY